MRRESCRTSRTPEEQADDEVIDVVSVGVVGRMRGNG